MKTFLRGFGATLIMLGIIAAAGAAGDCDGACGPGNSIGVMLLIGVGAIVSMGLGALLIAQGERFE